MCWSDTGKVKPEVLALGFEALASLDTGSSQFEPTPEQELRRTVFARILDTQNFKPRHEDLMAALKVKNEYAATVLLDRVAPTASELAQLAQDPWSLEYYGGINVLKKSLVKAGAAINYQDLSGRRMIDYAIVSKSVQLFDLLVQSGANQFRKSRNNNDREWIINRLIQNDAGSALTAYFKQTEFKNDWELQTNYWHIANDLGKYSAKTAIETKVSELHK